MRISKIGRVLLVSASMLAGAVAWAQQNQKPPAPVSTDVAVNFTLERSQLVPSVCCFWLKGGSADAAVTFWKGVGVAASLDGEHASNVDNGGVDVNKLSFLAGPRYTWTAWKGGDDHRLTLFGQGLFGVTHGFDGLYPALPTPTTSATSFGMLAGGGANFYLNKHWGIRLIEADYVRSQLPNAAANVQNDLRLSFGVTYHLQAAQTEPVTLTCAASPAVVFAGDPVQVSATAGQLTPKQSVVYSWSGVGATGTGSTANVATANLAPGSYTVNCQVKQGKAGKEGLKPWDAASSTASFTVKPFDPPTGVRCAVAPASLVAGQSATVTASAVSPQNRPLSYSFAATAGAISGSGSTATFNSNGVAAGTVTITCSATDDKGQTATATGAETITEPVVAAPSPEIKKLEERLALHSIFFPTNLPTAAKPDGGLVASQEATLTALATDFKHYQEFKPEAHLILSGHADQRGKPEFNKALSERRVARTKQFLVAAGIPEASIETRGLGSDENLSAAEVKALIEENPELTAAERTRVQKQLGVIVWAQNRRVDVTLSTTGEQSLRQFPFNAADSLTLLDKKNPAGKKLAAPVVTTAK